ncbi:Metallo-beta-lactamase superfamily protein [Mycena chlorophos]|uniref:Metallo-beta-lactamase superfamily protein n=1 Tax=Mycena chlorophos TaxID=658473 RepID=A0A8H6W0L5_MYCCL|nr:Metallo-beta-lactamase superfamily protein [Mycena chlorophos]
MSSYRDLEIPVSSATVSVKIFDTIPAGEHKNVKGSVHGMLEPVLPGHEKLECPIFCFFIEHTSSGKRIVFDLGLRKDLNNCAPSVAGVLQEFFPHTDEDIVDLMQAHGIDIDSIGAVVWSHSHVDHTGDVSRFPASTNVVVSKSLVMESYETNQSSTLLPSDLTGRKVNMVDFELQIGAFKAHDYFGDGSFYLLDVPGHQDGHMCGLARVTPTSFILMGGDACHHIGILRPTDLLHRNHPCPAALLQRTRHTVSHQHFPNAGSAFDLEQHTKPLLRVGSGPYQADSVVAQQSADALTVFDGNPDVFVVLAHDSSLLPLFGTAYPVVLDQWKAKGWKERMVWSFLDEENPAFRFNERT